MLIKPQSCTGCALHTLGEGFMILDGDGSSGILLVGEALGEVEVEKGKPFQGPAGHVLNNAITRAGLNRSALLILNAIWCRPPDNKLLGKPYYQPASIHCKTHHLDPAIKAAKPRVIVALGAIASISLIEQGDILDARGYPVWSDRYRCWVLPTVHPSYIMRGNFNYEAILIHDLQRAQEIAQVGYEPKWGAYLLDPTPSEALTWAKVAVESGKPISADIETLHKGHKEDEALLSDNSYIIQRISFAWEPLKGMSIPWGGAYMAPIRLLLESGNDKVWWNGAYDIPRIQYNGVLINGTNHDGMVAFHVLNTDLPKDLGTTATFLCPTQPRWKHMAGQRPAFYNAVDSDVALRCFNAAIDELNGAGLWGVYERHIVKLDHITSRMSRHGMPLNPNLRMEFAKSLAAKRAVLDAKLEEVVPFSIRPKFVYKNPPREREGLIKLGSKMMPVCSNCGFERPPKAHFAKPTKKFPDRKCHGFKPELRDIGEWARLEPLKDSSKLRLAYQDVMHHPKHFRGKGEDRRPTADENAIRTLLLKYTDDPFYPIVLRIAKIKKLQGNYIGYVKALEDGSKIVQGGLIVGADGRVHTVFSRNANTLRFTSENPNMQNIPRASDDEYRMVKDMFVAGTGMRFVARDYSGIESILVGYFANSKRYTRISMIDVHSFVTAWALYELEHKLKYEDLPQLEWSDTDLRESLVEIKKVWKPQRQANKHLGHATNYMAGAKKAQEVLFDELGVMVPLPTIKRFMDFYRQLFPEIPIWHAALALQVDGSRNKEPLVGVTTGAGYVRNPYNYLHRFYEVIRWEKVFGKWEWKFGESAKALIASIPQGTAGGIITEAMIRLDENYPQIIDGLLLQIHDELLGEWPTFQTEEVLGILKSEMEKPNFELPLDPSWGMGEFLAIPTEGKVGEAWGKMEEVKD